MEMVAPAMGPSQVVCEFVRQANPKTPAGPAGTGVGVGVGAGVGVAAGVGVGGGGSAGEFLSHDTAVTTKTARSVETNSLLTPASIEPVPSAKHKQLHHVRWAGFRTVVGRRLLTRRTANVP